MNKIEELMKALEAGSYNAAPGTLVQGAALQSEDMSNTMTLVTFDESIFKLQKMVKVESCKSTLAQFNRQLSYGIFGGSAVLEGNIGQEQTSDYVRVVVPITFYSETRRTTLQANLVETFDGVKAEDRSAKDAAVRLASDIEFDCFRGQADFSNAGVFDGNPLVIAAVPNMHGLDLQIRQSDSQRNTRDLMFGEFGGDDTVVISGGGNLTQDMIEDSAVRSTMNHGHADKLVVDPLVLSAYNKLVFGKERIVLGGSPQDATGGDLRKQWVSGGTVNVEASRFLSGKTRPQTQRALTGAPVAPVIASATSTTDAAAVTAFLTGQVYIYTASTCNELGESGASATSSMTIAADGDKGVITITNPSGKATHFNVYRTLAGGKAGTQKFIGRVKVGAGASTVFTDLGNKAPAFVTGFLIQGDTMSMKELAPFSRVKLAVTELSTPEGFYRFCSLAVKEPRKDVLIDNLK
jgi:hypothetical protein